MMRSSVAIATLAAGAIVALGAGCGRVGFDALTTLDGGDGAADAASPMSMDADSMVPIPDSGVAARLTALTAGREHSCATVDGVPHCWGLNADGQLGDGTTTDSAVPVPVAGLTASPFAIDCGYHHTCALVDGTAHCWGRGSSGELGDGSARDSVVPLAVTGLVGPVTRIAASEDFTCAIAGGRAHCWGDDRNGRLGQGVAADSPSPVAVDLDLDVVEICTGQDHGCVVTTDRTSTWCWGHNDNGVLGRPGSGTVELSPVQVAFPVEVTRIDEIDMGGDHACARTDRGLLCWGTGGRGELGDGRMMHSDVPVPVPAFSTATSTTRVSITGTAPYYDATCVVAAGRVQCWGSNTSGRAGNGTTVDQSLPVPVMGVPAADVVATGLTHACAAQTNGTVYCWGEGISGQLGDGTMADSLVATAVRAPW